MDEFAMLQRKYELLRHRLDEVSMRLCAAADAAVLGRGGASLVAKASGLSRTSIYAGLGELDRSSAPSVVRTRMPGRVRCRGGGRKRLADSNPDLLRDLDKLIDPARRDGSESPLRWTCKSTVRLTKELHARGHQVSQRTVWALLDQLGYSMQSNRKARKGVEYPDRDAQFSHIAKKVEQFQEAGFPVLSVDAKQSELIGRHRNGNRAWLRKGQPAEVDARNCARQEPGKAGSCGVHHCARNQSWVSVGINSDTAELAVATVRRWWKRMGARFYSRAIELLLVADGCGSVGSGISQWQIGLQKLAQELDMTIHVCHFPPGTSKWSKIEHRLLCYINEYWPNHPPGSRAVIVGLIANAPVETGQRTDIEVDDALYSRGIQIPNEDTVRIGVIGDEFQGEWNYKIGP